MKLWEPVIFTSLYVAALVLSWLTLFSLERFGATDVKSWAPFLQAVLSAAAIFSAYLLQSQKRKSERRDAEQDTVASLIELTRMIEWTADRANFFANEGTFTKFSAMMLAPAFSENLKLVRAQKIANLPNNAAIKAFIDFCHNASLFEGSFAFQAELVTLDKPATIGAFLRATQGIYDARTKLLKTLGASPEVNRQPRPAENPSPR